MKERLRSSQASNNSRNEQTIQKSMYESPKKSMQQYKSDKINDDLQYKLQKVFQEAGNREQRYINLIKDQEQKLSKQSQKYLETLKEIKTSFIQFINSGEKKESEWRVNGIQQQFQSVKTAQKLNSLQFSLKTLKQYNKKQSQGKIQPQLQCKVNFYYFTPFVEDSLRYKMPQNLILTLNNLYPNNSVSKYIRIIKQQDESDNINCLLNRIPFQISTEDNQSINIQFTIPCNQDAINYYKRKQIQIQLINRQGLFIFAYAKISLRNILYYQEKPIEWQLKPISFYSTLEGVKIGQMSIKFGNKLQLTDKNDHYKIQSTNPMELNSIKSLINYNDEESRMIQRISKFKTNTNSLLLGIGSSKQVKGQRFFENENDKIILMHRQKKELQSILQYKNSHKSELMGKLFNEAIDRYYLTQCQIGAPKYVIFNYHNQHKDHKKVFAKIQLNCKNSQNQPLNAASLAIQQQIQTTIISPRQARILLRQDLIELLDQSYIDYQFYDQQLSLLAISGMCHSIIVRIICMPLKPSLSKESNLKNYYELKVNLCDQYNQQVDSFHTKVKIKEPSIENTIYIHGYAQTESQLEIPFDQLQEKTSKKIILTNFPQFQYKWNNQTKLNGKIVHKNVGEKLFYLVVNDSQNLYQICCYNLIINTYARLSDTLNIQLGEVRKLSLQFTINEDILTQKYKQIQNAHPSKGKAAKDQIRVQFASSQPQKCVVTCQNQPQLICKLNKVYMVDVKIQTFDVRLNSQKILIHAINLDTNKPIKRWLLVLQKQKINNYKQVYKLSCQHSKPMKYKFQFMNEDSKQKSFRFYSSNLSIMTVPYTLIPLITNQKATIELQFNVRIGLSVQELLQPLKVILTVTDGSIFINYLFQIIVRMK